MKGVRMGQKNSIDIFGIATHFMNILETKGFIPTTIQQTTKFINL